MKLQLFNGGLNTRLAPHLIQPNQSVECTNVDMESGTLKPIKSNSATGILTERNATYFDAEQEWVSRALPTSFVEFQGKLYWTTTDGTPPKKYSGGVERNLGIAPPTASIIATQADGADSLNGLTVANSTGGDLPSGDLEYMLVNERNGIKAKPFKYVVYASSTTSTRADGSFLGLDTAGRFDDIVLSNPLITLLGNTRSVVFSDLQGTVATACTVYRKYQGTWREVGALIDSATVVLDDVYDISANAELDFDDFTAFDGTYQYVHTFYNANDGTESAPSAPSNELEVTSGAINLTNIQISFDPQVTHLRVYRVGGNLTQFTLVAELTNTIQSYKDTLKDSEVPGDLLESDNYYEAPANLQYLSESYAMLFGAVDTTLRFTPIGKPNAWPPEYSIEFDSPITGIGPVANGLLVFTRYTTHLVTGTGPFTLVQQLLRGDQGCRTHYSIQKVTEGMLCWQSEDGICVSSGNNVQLISKESLGRLQLNVTSSAVVDERYYCHTLEGDTLVWDFRFTPMFYYLDLNVSSIVAANGQLYGWQAGELYEVALGTDNLSFLYKSPKYSEGQLTVPKTYKKFYFSHNGDIIINILINDSVVTTKALSGKDTTEVMVPQDKQRGYYVQFEVQGTGELLEIEYTASVTRSG
jgi:hypothetical protein